MNYKTVSVGPYTLHADASGYFCNLFLQNGLNYEIHVHKELERLIPGCRGFLDLGANIGLHVLGAKTIDPEVPVYAFEPSPRNVQVLCQNVHYNKLKSVYVYPVAVSSQQGFVWFNPDEENSQPSAADNSNYPRIWPAFQVGNFIRPGSVDVFKVDIEGFEMEAWLGMIYLFGSKPKPRMIFELSFPCLKNTGVDPVEELRWLETFGYEFTVLENKPGMRKGPLKAQAVVEHLLGVGEQVADILAEVP
jgi:FkbM family methyltransferase